MRGSEKEREKEVKEGERVLGDWNEDKEEEDGLFEGWD